MKKEKSKSDIAKELKVRFPFVSLLEIRGWIDITHMDDPKDVADLEASLEEESERGRLHDEHYRLHVAEHVERITASMAHRKLQALLAGKLPVDVDDEHCAATLAYGFAIPSRERKFIGGSKISVEHLQHNVRNKLGPRFSQDHFRTVIGYLIGLGVIEDKQGLSMQARTRTMPQAGKVIVGAVQQFLKEFKSGG